MALTFLIARRQLCGLIDTAEAHLSGYMMVLDRDLKGHVRTDCFTNCIITR